MDLLRSGKLVIQGESWTNSIFESEVDDGLVAQDEKTAASCTNRIGDASKV